MRRILNNPNFREQERITEDIVNTYGEVDNERRCLRVPLPFHSGDIDSPGSGIYATHVTGSSMDYLVIDPEGEPAFYDGQVNERGFVFTNNLEPYGAVAEVKMGYALMNKFIASSNLARDPNLTYDPTSPSQREKNLYNDMIKQINRETLVADRCGLLYFMSFSNRQAALAARELFFFRFPSDMEDRKPRVELRRSVRVHWIRYPR